MKNRTVAMAGILAVLVLLMTPSVSFPQKIETKDGIRIIHNVQPGKWGSTPKVRLDPIRVIGDVDTDAENLAFNMPKDLAEDSRGNIYIADSSNGRIQKFSPAGMFLASLGRKGQGPGEFGSVSSLAVDADDHLFAFDDRQRRLTVLTTDGKEVRTIKFVKTPISGLGLMKDGAFLAAEPLSSYPEPLSPKILLKVFDDQEAVRAEFGQPVDFGEPVTNQVGNSVYFAVGRDGGPVASFSYQNRIEKYTPAGQIIWSADRPLNFDTKVIEKGEFKRTARSSTYRGPNMNRCSNGVAVDAAGRIWVVTYRRQIKPEEVIRISMSGNQSGSTRKVEGNTDLRTTDMYQLDVFNGEGALLGSLPVSQFVDGIWIFGDRLYLLDRDRGVAYHQYRIVER
ncbi:MAG: 6-bladed beta-propeller [Candidatus Aminicenantes bacterium]|nr:6-bladed beta-propeller [Candidatus Aminicenantes bacterium]